MISPNCILPSWTSMQYLIPYSVCFFLSSWKKSYKIMSATVLGYRNCPFWLLTCRSWTSLLHFMLMMDALFWDGFNCRDCNSKIKSICKRKIKEKERKKKEKEEKRKEEKEKRKQTLMISSAQLSITVVPAEGIPDT